VSWELLRVSRGDLLIVRRFGARQLRGQSVADPMRALGQLGSSTSTAASPGDTFAPRASRLLVGHQAQRGWVGIRPGAATA